jgi:hypothetical protein
VAAGNARFFGTRSNQISDRLAHMQSVAARHEQRTRSCRRPSARRAGGD